MTPEAAETLAIQALAWLAGNEELLPVFLGATGASSEDLRQGVSDTAFLGAVLDFLMQDDSWVVEFCDTSRTPYDQVMQARQALPGGADFHWT